MRAVSRYWIAAARLVLLLLFSVVGAAEAAPQNLSALQIYERGDYLAAAKAAEQEGGGEGFALAARSTLADATLREQPCMECLKQAEDYVKAGADFLVSPGFVPDVANYAGSNEIF